MSTNSINAAKPTSALIGESAKLEPAKSKPITDSLSSATKTETKTCLQKIKECFTKIIDWIKEHIFCCKKSKPEAASQSVTNKTETAETEKQKEARLEKEKFDNWFKNLSADEQKGVNQAIQDFQRLGYSVIDQLKKLKDLVSDPKKSDQEISKFIKDHYLDHTGKFFKCVQKDRKAFCDVLAWVIPELEKETKKAFEKDTDLMHAEHFFVYKGTKVDSPSSLINLEGIARSFSPQLRAKLLTIYRTENAKPDFTEENFFALIRVNPKDATFGKMEAKIDADFEKIYDTENIWAEARKRFDEILKAVAPHEEKKDKAPATQEDQKAKALAAEKEKAAQLEKERAAKVNEQFNKWFGGLSKDKQEEAQKGIAEFNRIFKEENRPEQKAEYVSSTNKLIELCSDEKKPIEEVVKLLKEIGFGPAESTYVDMA
jgi:hypothetical protein